LRQIIAYLCFFIIFSAPSLHAQTVRIGFDQNLWYPFSYLDNGEPKGLHFDIVNLALKNLKYKVSYEAFPWKRCLVMAKHGFIDAVLNASYKPERAEYLIYPPDAAILKKSDYRITQVEYSIISHRDEPYEFDGNVNSIPKPIRITLGYSVADDLKKDKIPIHETPSDLNSIKMLIRDRAGSAIALGETARFLMKKAEFKNRLYISKKTFKSKSYFFVFAKNYSIPKIEQTAIWNEIKRIRENDELMEKLIKKY